MQGLSIFGVVAPSPVTMPDVCLAGSACALPVVPSTIASFPNLYFLGKTWSLIVRRPSFEECPSSLQLFFCRPACRNWTGILQPVRSFPFRDKTGSPDLIQASSRYLGLRRVKSVTNPTQPRPMSGGFSPAFLTNHDPSPFLCI